MGILSRKFAVGFTMATLLTLGAAGAALGEGDKAAEDVITPVVLADTVATSTSTDVLGPVAMEPGMWTWNQKTKIAGIPLKETNTECLTPKKADTSLTELALDLEESCFVEDVVPQGTGYSFTLVCGGDHPGRAKGILTDTNGRLELNANGKAKAWGLELPFSFKAWADREGDCPAEVLAAALEKEAEEEALEAELASLAVEGEADAVQETKPEIAEE